jgi:hypothetical protein
VISPTKTTIDNDIASHDIAIATPVRLHRNQRTIRAELTVRFLPFHLYEFPVIRRRRLAKQDPDRLADATIDLLGLESFPPRVSFLTTPLCSPGRCSQFDPEPDLVAVSGPVRGRLRAGSRLWHTLRANGRT